MSEKHFHIPHCLIDHLTATDHRSFEACFEKLCARLRAADEQRKETHPSWLGALDIEHARLDNDQHEHPFSNEALLLVSFVLRETIRSTDQLFRFGGGELFVIFERTARTGVDIALERMRSTLAGYSFPEVGSITINAGYTQILPGDIPTMCALRADTALHDAKCRGRNTAHSHERLVRIEAPLQHR